MAPWNFFDPGSQYGGTYAPGDFGRSPAGEQYFNQNPQAFYTQRTAAYGSGNDPFSQFVRQRYGLWNQGYEAALGTNPHLTVQQYGGQQPLTEKYFRGLFHSMAPSQRGESSSTYGGGRMRWLGG